ncbi:hypothetical protein RP20_CCG012206 [Aedes albopictus]|nr:hypothetical protein RP20_CCG012206 [Aedes albopictus]
MFHFVVPLVILQVLPSLAMEGELILQRFEQTTGFNIFKADLRVTKLNRTCAVLNGTVDVFVDVDNNYLHQMKFAYSRLGNNQFVEYPMKIPSQRFCDYLNTTYREYQHLFKETSNIPQVGPEGLCPFPSGKYWVKNFTIQPGLVPDPFYDALWRMTVLLVRGKSTASMNLYMQRYREGSW